VEACKVDALVFGELNELLADARLGETGAVLAAAGATSARRIPDPLLAWHALGRATTELADQAAAQGGTR
jgi:hypothetical protein